MKYILLLLVIAFSFRSEAIEKVTFKSADGVTVTADLHFSHPKSNPVILLFHQAGWSRGEYVEIAPTLNQIGYNCIAVDLRSGNLVNGVRNETAKDARRLLKQTRYLDAYQDMIATLNYVKKLCPESKIIVMGSSYSASLSLILASEQNAIDGVVSFSPGEYFKSMGKGKDFIKTAAQSVECAAFIACSRNEKSKTYPIYEAIISESKTFYIPTQGSGNHGAKALFVKHSDHKEYWSALMAFLSSM